MADGYARASGKVGVAVATSGPGATNMVTGIATAMMDSVADRLHHRPGRQPADRLRRVPGNRHHRHHAADHQAQLPGHARGGRRAGRARGVSHRRVRPARSGADRHHQGRAAVVVRVRLGRRGARAARRARSGSPSSGRGIARALELINVGAAAARSSPATASCSANAIDEFRAFVDAPGIPVAMTLLGIGGLPAVAPAQPRHDGHARRSLGQHRDSGSRPAHRARHALRRSRDRQPEDLRAERAQDPRRHRPGRDRQERPGRRRHRRRPARRARACCPASPAASAPRGCATSTSSRATRRSATSRTCPTTGICMRRT